MRGPLYIGATHLGPPLEVIDMGETYLPEEVVLEYIESQREVFTCVCTRDIPCGSQY